MTRFAYLRKFCVNANFSYVCTSGHVYAFAHVCKICTYPKVGKLHLPQIKCKSHFAYMQTLLYANLVMCTESKICTREYLVNNAE